MHCKKKSNVIIIVKEGEQWLGYYLFICIYTYFFFFAGPTRFSSFPEDDVRVFFVIINLFICFFFFEWGATVVLQSAQINLCGWFISCQINAYSTAQHSKKNVGKKIKIKTRCRTKYWYWAEWPKSAPNYLRINNNGANRIGILSNPTLSNPNPLHALYM